MTAIICESLIYSVSKVLQEEVPLTYYQYRDLSSFIELITLHDEVLLLLGDFHDDKFYQAYEWLIDHLKSTTDIKFKKIDSSNRVDFLTSKVVNQFNQIVNEIYQHDFGITIDELLKKSDADRSFKEDITPFENVFKKAFKGNKIKHFANFIFESWDSNQYLSFIRYLFRTHLLKALSEIFNLTPVYENSRLLTLLLQNKCYKSPHMGSMPHKIYETVNTIFVNSLAKLPNKSIYPKIPILLRYIITKTKYRESLLDEVIKLRNTFRNFRKEYNVLENVINNSDENVATRTKSINKLEDSLQKILIPTILSFGKTYSASVYKQFFNSLFGKYNVGDIQYKLKFNENSDVSESLNLSSPSLTKLGIDFLKTLYETHRDSELFKLNEPLLEVTKIVIESKGIQSRANQIMPLKDYNEEINLIIEDNIYDISQHLNN